MLKPKSLILALFVFVYVGAVSAGSLAGDPGTKKANNAPPGNGVCPFQDHGAYPTGFGPTGIANGDVNGDGIPDLVVTAIENIETEVGSASVYLGNGDGTFQQRQRYKTGVDPWAVALADFNNDSHLDIAVVNKRHRFPDRIENLYVFLNKGDGTFQVPPMKFKIAKKPISLAVGDFNRDRNADLLVATNGVSELSLLLGNGDGTFRKPLLLATVNPPQSVTVGDFNGDGKLDIAATTINSVAVFLGNGNGTFQARADYPTGKNGRDIVAADVDGNGTLDLLVADGTLRVFLGVGDGTFLPSQQFHAGTFPSSLAVADFNGDGKLDVAVGNYDAQNGKQTITILAGRGDGSFGAPISCRVTGQTRDITVGDFNLDGSPDVATVNAFFDVTVLLNSGK